MAKHDEINGTNRRHKLAEHLTTLISDSNIRAPREATHFGPMEYRPKKAAAVHHGPEKQEADALCATQSVRWGDGFRFIDLFAGIGGMRLGFESVGGHCVFTSEWDSLAQDTYEANFGERPQGDITKIAPEAIPDHDLLIAGFPCQAFSIIGNRKGFADTRGTLFFNVEQILRVKRPPAFLLENVKQFKTHDNGRAYRGNVNPDGEDTSPWN